MFNAVNLPSCDRNGRRDLFVPGPVIRDQRDPIGTHGSGVTGSGAIGMTGYSLGLIFSVGLLIAALVVFGLIMIGGVLLCV